MSMSLSFSDAGIEHLKRWEGFELESYQDTGGVWTVGYGTTRGVTEDTTITEQKAEEWLRRDIGWAEAAVHRHVEVPLTQSQYDSLVAFVYNIGEPQFKSSTLLRKLNRRNYSAVPAQMLRWTYDEGQYIQGLKNRRLAEAAMWNEAPVEVPEGARPEQRPGKVQPNKGPKVREIAKEDDGIKALLMTIAGAIATAFQYFMDWLNAGGEVIRDVHQQLGPWQSFIKVIGANGVPLALGVTIIGAIVGLSLVIRDRKEGA